MAASIRDRGHMGRAALQIGLRVCGGLVLVRIAVVAGLLTILWAQGRLARVDDYAAFTGAASRWLSGGSFYEPFQLAGPYAIDYHSVLAVLYPPVALWLAVPFTVLPVATWWLVPAAVVAWAAWRLRPEPWSWPLLLALVTCTRALDPWWYGNPGMWVIAAEAAGLVAGWPAIVVLVKPTLAPFALIGIRRRSWWAALGVFALACLPLGSLWLDWLRAAVLNPTNGGLMYSLPQVPAMALPLLLWIGSARGRTTMEGVLDARAALQARRLAVGVMALWPASRRTHPASPSVRPLTSPQG